MNNVFIIFKSFYTHKTFTYLIYTMLFLNVIYLSKINSILYITTNNKINYLIAISKNMKYTCDFS